MFGGSKFGVILIFNSWQGYFLELLCIFTLGLFIL